jgi:hypothetical protein
MSPTRRCLLAALATAGVLAPSAQAATWSEIPSNTTEDITAVEYQGPSRFWFATGAGHVFRRVGDGFVQTGSAPGVVFNDIEFQDGGPVGFAVGTNGGVLRSADSGASWTPVTGITGGRRLDVNDCADPNEAIGDVDSVRFAGNAHAWLAAGGTQIYRTVAGVAAADVGAAGTDWQAINQSGSPCMIDRDIDDVFAVPGSAAMYFAAKALGAMLFSRDALRTPAMLRPAAAGAGAGGTRRLTGDPANTNRQWAISSAGAGAGYVARTTDGWATSGGWTIVNPDRGSITTPAAVDFKGGTVAAVGSAGMIAESVDGASFSLDPVATAATQDWRSVSLASASAGAAGGPGGMLAATANANAVPAATSGSALPGTPAGSASRPAPLVVSPPRRRPLPVFGFPSRRRPPVVGGAARKHGDFIVLGVVGALRPPARLPAAVVCRGRVVLTVRRAHGQRRDLTEAAVGLPRSCAFAKRLRVRRARVAGRRSLRLRVAFKGNALVGASSVTYVVPIR